MQNRKELIKALKLIHDSCESITGEKCTLVSGEFGCPIFEILGDCPLDNVPSEWTFKKDIEEEIEEKRESNNGCNG